MSSATDQILLSLERAFQKMKTFKEAKEAPSGFSRDADLKNWNTVQGLLWKVLCSELGWNRNDGEFFQAFGQFFFDYWERHHQIPEVEDAVNDQSLMEYLLFHRRNN